MSYYRLCAIILTMLLVVICAAKIPSENYLNKDNGSPKAPALDSLLYKVFSALKNESESEYLKLMITEEEMERLLISKLSNDKKDEAIKKMRDQHFYNKQKKAMLDLFGLAIKRGKELKINWKDIIFKSYTADSSIIKNSNVMNYNGEITFSADNNQYYIKFMDCFAINGRMIITGIAAPYQDFSKDNLAKNEKYHAPYLKRCIALHKKHPQDLPPKVTPEKYCECSFNNIAVQTFGEELLKDTLVLHTQPGKCD